MMNVELTGAATLQIAFAFGIGKELLLPSYFTFRTYKVIMGYLDRLTCKTKQ